MPLPQGIFIFFFIQEIRFLCSAQKGGPETTILCAQLLLPLHKSLPPVASDKRLKSLGPALIDLMDNVLSL